ncbi:MAG: hypothetical protein HOQ26_02070 [Gemmatimonadaceae bacterium]|nr:hypothetical protein [Gemmatimonadaceae bacterium]NUQ91677.1 hypothetical protein [Gemmatimonadaceae bacterium]
MSTEQIVPGGDPRVAALRGALGTLRPDQRLRVQTTTDGELRGHVRQLDGETLVLAPAPNSDQVTRIPFASILGVDRVGNHAGAGAGIAAALAAIPFFWVAALASEWNKELGGFGVIVLFIALLGVGIVASIGAVVGAAFDRVEPVVMTKIPTG